MVVEPVEGNDGVVEAVPWDWDYHAVDQAVDHVVGDVLGEHVLKQPPEDRVGDGAAAAAAAAAASKGRSGRMGGRRRRGGSGSGSRDGGGGECRGRQGLDRWEVDLCRATASKCANGTGQGADPAEAAPVPLEVVHPKDLSGDGDPGRRREENVMGG